VEGKNKEIVEQVLKKWSLPVGFSRKKLIMEKAG
jgi:hypothetical protein